MCWLDFGELKQDEHNILCSGSVRDLVEHRNGVVLLLNQQTRRCLLEWKPLTEKLLDLFTNLKTSGTLTPYKMFGKEILKTYWELLNISIIIR